MRPGGIEEPIAFYQLPIFLIKHIRRLELRHLGAGEIGVDEEVASLNINLDMLAS